MEPSLPKQTQARKFSGFSSPNFTSIPDEFFDELLSDLTESELKVALYIMRRTFGFKKSHDEISLRQMVEGITTSDGRVLDRGTGLSKSSVARGVNGLVAKGVIVTARNSSRSKGDQATTYQLRFAEGGVSQIETRGVPNLTPQETVKQQTVKEDVSNIRKAHDEIKKAEFARGSEWSMNESIVQDYIGDFAREFNDQASLKVSTSRAMGLWRNSTLSIDAFIVAMMEARRVTQERSGSINASDPPGAGFVRKRKMAYYFEVLARLVSPEGEP